MKRDPKLFLKHWLEFPAIMFFLASIVGDGDTSLRVAQIFIAGMFFLASRRSGKIYESKWKRNTLLIIAGFFNVGFILSIPFLIFSIIF